MAEPGPTAGDDECAARWPLPPWKVLGVTTASLIRHIADAHLGLISIPPAAAIQNPLVSPPPAHASSLPLSSSHSLSPSPTMDAAAPPTPPTTPPVKPPRATNKPFAVRPSPTGGVGAFATRALRPGEVLLEETPLFACARADIFAAYARLPRKKQRKAWALHASDHFKPGTPWLEAVWDTNSFGTGGNREAGLFPIAARFNHACAGRDNVHFAYDAERRRLRLWVAAAAEGEGEGVAEGEELKLCYGRGKTPALLYCWYGFRCACGACEGLSDKEMKSFAVKW